MRRFKNINAKTLMIFFAFAILFSYYTISTINKNSSTSVSIDPYFSEEKLNYNNIIGNTFEEEEILKEGFNLKSLNSHIFYYSPDQYNFVINFNSDVTSTEIDSFMSMFSNAFICAKQFPIGSTPYCKELDLIHCNKGEYQPLKNLSLRVYIDDVKAFRFDYSFIKTKYGNALDNTTYFENVYPTYNIKRLNKDFVESFKKKNENLRRTLTIRRTFKNDGVIIVNVKSDKEYTDRYINKLKKKIEEDLAPKLEKLAFDNYSTNNSYLGIVLQMQKNNSIYYESTYYNGKNKKWIDEDWMNFGFIKHYISEE